MRPYFVLGVALIGIVVACSSNERSGFGDAPKEVDEAGAPPPTLGGDAANTLTVDVNISGVVYAPNGTLPLSNALVYVTSEEPAAIPDGAYCDQCVKLQEGTFAVSAPDGKFEIKTDLPKGKVFVVVQKGQFRRVRSLEIDKEGPVDLSKDETTLPGRSDPSKGDDVPKMVVLKDDADFDVIDESLKKLGITEFDIKQDRSLLLDETALGKYHVVFIPCGNSDDENATSPQAQANMQAFVAKGGKLYVTDWSYEFVRQPFPGFLSWEGETAAIGSAASGDEWDAPATAVDQGLSDWLAATGDSSFTVEGNWTTIKDVITQKGKNPKGEEVDIAPKVWVTGKKGNVEFPTTVSFENQCGRVLFSTYHTENSSFGSGSTSLTAQEKALLYVLLEVGVCVGERPGVN
jgi:hypothetical protein